MRKNLQRGYFIEVGGNPQHRPATYFTSRVLYRFARMLAATIPFCKQMSAARPAMALWIASVKYPAHLYIAHYLGALPAALRAANKYKARVIFDAEDFHRGEEYFYAAEIQNVIGSENRLLPQVDLITTASPLITKEYKKYYPTQNITTINNVFSNFFVQPISQGSSVLKLFWFSQHIGMYRGLEIFIQALNLLPGKVISLTIMGNTLSDAYNKSLLELSNDPSSIIFRSTAAPETIFSIAAQYDIGLAGEMPSCRNKEICLSNKIFTYMLAGNCILASDMQGQTEFMQQHPGIGFTYVHDDPKDLAEKIDRLYNDRSLLQHCKEQARQLAANELNWENEKEKWMPLVNKLLMEEKNNINTNNELAPEIK
jgi:glycosyltransferase involved in cell wall biosynthesis